MEIILASGSPRRKELLTQMGLPFRVVSSDIDETFARVLPPRQQVKALARAKAEAVAGQVEKDCLVIAADTIVVLDDKVLGKPAGPQEAKEMLRALSGRTHTVYTGLALQHLNARTVSRVATEVTFRALSQEEMDYYVSTGDPLDKAGAYGIQGFAGTFVSALKGDYFNVMGLPICALSQLLIPYGVKPPYRKEEV